MHAVVLVRTVHVYSAGVSNQQTRKPLVVGLTPLDLGTHTLPVKNAVSVIGEPQETVGSGNGVDVGKKCFVSKHMFLK